jgi:hypothetical protein
VQNTGTLGGNLCNASPAADGTPNWLALDAAVVCPGTAANPPSMFPFPLEPLTGPVLGFDVELMQNAFNTNTPLFSWETEYWWRFALRAAP